MSAPRGETFHFAPMIAARDAGAAIAFYGDVFGAAPVGPTLKTPEGVVAHAELAIGGGRIMLADARFAANGAAEAPPPATLHAPVDNVDAVFERAVAAGAEPIQTVKDQFYGQRMGRIRDPFGHDWILTQEIERLSPEELEARMAELFSAA